MPSLPTDNLYKFVAIAGIALIFFSSGLLEVKKQRMTTIRAQISQNIAEMDAIRTTLPPNRLKGSPNDAEDIKAYREFTVKLGMASNGIQDLQALKIEMKIAKCLSKVSNFIGFFLALFGFSLWYVRVQKPLDKKLQFELKAAKQASIIAKGAEGSGG